MASFIWKNVEFGRDIWTFAFRPNATLCLQELSRAAVSLGYELDLSLTNARRYNEESCEKLTTCTNKARKQSEAAITELRAEIYQCVYA